MTSIFTESVVEEAALEWFKKLGYEVLLGATIAPGEPAAGRDHYDEVILSGCFRADLSLLNPQVPTDSSRQVNLRPFPGLLLNRPHSQFRVNSLRESGESVPGDFRLPGTDACIVHDLS